MTPANERGRRSNPQRTQPFIHRRPHDLSTPPAIPQNQGFSPIYPTLATPIPSPVPQPFIPPQIHSDSSSGTLELCGSVHQPFLPEALYLSPGIPTRNAAELQAFVNHCRFILGARQTWIINHSITDLHKIIPAPAVFTGHLWRYRIIINTDGILEDYRIIARTTGLPIIAALQHAFMVYYDWNAQGYTVSIDE